MSSESPRRGKLRLRDVLRADLPTVRNAMAGVSYEDNPLARRLSKTVNWLERHGEHQMKVLYVPPLSLLWGFLPGDGSPAATIHKTYLHELWSERGLLGRASLLAQIAILWPVVNFALIGWFTWINGSAIRKRTGKSIARQALEQLQVSAAHGILAPWYYTFDLHEDAKRRQAGDYLNRFETKGGLYRMVKRYRPREGWVGLSDKVKYTEHCREHGVATIPTVAVAEQGTIRMTTGGGESLPPQDLFLKPTCGRGGEGADWWGCAGPDSYTNSRGDVTFTSAQLLDYIKKISRERPYLVSVRATNHPEIADLSNGALSTLRILTLQNESGGYEATDAVFRMAVGTNTIVDNFHAGGIAANVDMATGELGLATDVGLRPDRGWCDRHPTTGAKIVGRRLPFWEEVVDLVQRGHALFPNRSNIGWDVAILESGPCAVESNGSPDLDIHQRCAGAPLGRARLGELLALHVEEALATRAAQGPAPRAP